MVPGLLTLGVTLLRLWAELHGWGPRWANTEGGGPFAVIGITWLIFVFGAWFGLRLVGMGEAPLQPGRTLLATSGVTAVAIALGFVVLGVLGSGSFVALVACNAAIYVTAVALVWRLWPALARTTLVYGLLARLPVIAVTIVAVANEWGTHYEKIGPGAGVPLPGGERMLLAALAQLFFWIPVTILIGSVMGSLAATLARRSPGTTPVPPER